jgi:polyisoprenoid-binding protein YceI
VHCNPSANFFHVSEYATVTFSLIELVPSADVTLQFTGTLRVLDPQ